MSRTDKNENAVSHLQSREPVVFGYDKFRTPQGEVPSEWHFERNWFNSETAASAGDLDLSDVRCSGEFDNGIKFQSLYSSDSRPLLAERAAACALTRIMVGLPATELIVDDYNGICKGTGQVVTPGIAAMLSMAGFLWEYRFRIQSLEELVVSPSNELSEVRRIIGDLYINQYEMPCPPITDKNTPLYRATLQTMRVLRTELSVHSYFVSELALKLARSGHITAEQLDGMRREYDRDLHINGCEEIRYILH